MPNTSASTINNEARRQMELALYLMDVRAASVRDIILGCEAYAGYANEESAARQVKRDLADLREMGIAAVSVREHPGGVRWKIDERSTYADASLVNQQVALLIQVLCRALGVLAADRTFEAAEALRAALSKLSGAAGSARQVVAAAAGSELSRSSKRLVEVVRKQTQLTLRYQDGSGNESVREVLPYGCYPLNGHLYVVAYTLNTEVDGVCTEVGAIRRYRDDRIVRWEDAHVPFDLPPDFDVSDWCVLPFQLGDRLGELTVHGEAARIAELRAKCGNAEVEALDAETLRFAACASWEAAAAWAIGEGVCPTAPNEAVECYLHLLEQVAQGVYEADGARGKRVNVRRTRESGRTLTRTSTARLFSLLNLFSVPNARISAEQAAAALGVSADEARTLLDSLSAAALPSGYVPVLYDEESDTWEFDDYSDYEVPKIRLSEREAEAVEAALAELGVAESALAALPRLKAAFWPVDTVADTEDAKEPQPASLDEFTKLIDLSDAVVHTQGRRFAYRGRSDAQAQPRRCAPLALFSRDGHRYLFAYDFDRNSTRQFRVDRMEHIERFTLTKDEVSVIEQHDPTMGTTWLEGVDRTELVFSAEWQTSFFNWEGLAITETLPDGRLKATVPNLNTTWLPRHIAAFGGEVTTTDEALARQVEEYAKSLAG